MLGFYSYLWTLIRIDDVFLGIATLITVVFSFAVKQACREGQAEQKYLLDANLILPFNCCFFTSILAYPCLLFTASIEVATIVFSCFQPCLKFFNLVDIK